MNSEKVTLVLRQGEEIGYTSYCKSCKTRMRVASLLEILHVG